MLTLDFGLCWAFADMKVGLGDRAFECDLTVSSGRVLCAFRYQKVLNDFEKTTAATVFGRRKRVIHDGGGAIQYH